MQRRFKKSLAWWLTLAVPAFERRREKNCYEFEASLSQLASTWVIESDPILVSLFFSQLKNSNQTKSSYELQCLNEKDAPY